MEMFQWRSLTDFNTIHPKLHCTAETEQNNTINYLGISIHRTAHNIKIAIYRKSTFNLLFQPPHKT
jgi:hypothetical protein